MTGVRRVWGIHAAEAALDYSPDKIVKAWLDDHRMQNRLQAVATRLDELGVEIVRADRKRLDRLADPRKHQGILLELDLPGEQGEAELLDTLDAADGHPLYLVLDHVQDPHNLGACLRTCDAAGVKGLVVTKDQSVGLTPTVAKVASGAAETVPVYRVTNLARCLDRFKQRGYWVVGAAGEAERTLYELDLRLPLVVVMGAEGVGLRRLTRERCDFLLRIPMVGGVESLNLSVATGIVLYEVMRQRSRPAP
ncbi:MULTISPECIES: 23S rRNA (guanosine(2251)-2'-O)-methyltransferase RlmB [Methylococcus]|mgnify:CR=1 FL=1|jgi:23S rRNA (guanosine2251-2'-O)-methyltransferase|uniref:23S rRNA (guanosine-2'-O-)-methyltransferase RlmB n=2 Tax=Methylococcus capsulatus TaxID=414 RepID=Q606P1_METCA|nr:23S rRNA (guanosine(2251)-2'-O)-methyltransferase RlmB [Methylococcus capsulatus]AAU92001.1 RNA methyltransferase, TrmH family, group 3 [Methylococcus capsulatus str. Bath]QXP87400.1 23S rRNA (guanosine(2251)-2'-O)-methyltransferase RlmB [Methylococcus capsulatus]QXP91246.1 23S rRNA (guanosine(2251)-2'-O)-methyltransferase RlmB [Methylococcus capsulatus]QXP92859.1 23S rRNA (guanosine(2251)-2'-O)-methyltransferase RlmB [Methylococcus capsulatus]UQN12403.1 23S rRNA (guanosine(2251)-2'-O)-meth